MPRFKNMKTKELLNYKNIHNTDLDFSSKNEIELRLKEFQVEFR